MRSAQNAAGKSEWMDKATNCRKDPFRQALGRNVDLSHATVPGRKPRETGNEELYMQESHQHCFALAALKMLHIITPGKAPGCEVCGLQQEIASKRDALQRDLKSSSIIAAASEACPAHAAHASLGRTTCSEALGVQQECTGASRVMRAHSAVGAYAASGGAASLRRARKNRLRRRIAKDFCGIRTPHYQQARHNASL